MVSDWAGALGKTAAAAALLGVVAACGGRSAQPVASVQDVDVQLTCSHIDAELAANAARADDLRGERNDNRVRSLSRVPGAIVGSPITAIVLADPSIAIYRELNALSVRNSRLQALQLERGCTPGAPVVVPAAPPSAPAAAVASAPAPLPAAPPPPPRRPQPSQSLQQYEALGPSVDAAPAPAPQ